MSNLVPVPTLKEGSSPKIVGMQRTSPPTTNPPLQKPDFPLAMGLVGHTPGSDSSTGGGDIRFQEQFQTRETPRIGFGLLPDYRIFELHRPNMSQKVNLRK